MRSRGWRVHIDVTLRFSLQQTTLRSIPRDYTFPYSCACLVYEHNIYKQENVYVMLPGMYTVCILPTQCGNNINAVCITCTSFYCFVITKLTTLNLQERFTHTACTPIQDILAYVSFIIHGAYVCNRMISTAGAFADCQLFYFNRIHCWKGVLFIYLTRYCSTTVFTCIVIRLCVVYAYHVCRTPFH